jgi:N-acetylglucosamine-6-sulfatase
MGRNSGDGLRIGRVRLVALVCLLALLAVACSTSAPGQETPTPRNIVFVLADDMRADDLAYMNRLVAWSQGGTRFTESAFHTTPQCCPARTSMLTGKYAHNHGVDRNPKSRTRSGYDLFMESGAGESYLPTWLDDAGYATGIFGKFLNGYGGGNPPRGFDVARVSKSAAEDPEMIVAAEAYYRKNVAEGRPVFAAVWLRSPHGPLDHPTEYEGDFDAVEREITPAYDEADVSEKMEFVRNLQRLDQDAHMDLENTWRTRLEMSRRIEDAVLQMTRVAEETGQLDNTYFLVSSDNGVLLGEHRIKSGKALPYDATARSFLLFKGPGVVTQERTELVTDNDVAPTLADLANVPVPENYALDGRSLVPLLHGETFSTWRAATLIEHPAPHINDGLTPGYKAVRTKDELYIEWEDGHVEHYADEYQTVPANDPARQAELEAKLDALTDCAGDSCREAEGP